MIPNTVYDYCCEDISLIENYEAALADTSETEWVCHHKLGIELNKTHKELEEMGLYYNRPACELCFMTLAEHTSLHHSNKIVSEDTRNLISIRTKEGMKKEGVSEAISKAHKDIPLSIEHRKAISESGKKRFASQEAREKHSKACKGVNSGPRPKFKWLTPDGEISIMDMSNAKKNHKYWTLIGPVS